MKYKVRTKDGGELDYESFGQVEQAWLLGLIDPDDELLEEGKTLWRKAGSIPLLVNARRSGDQVWVGTWFAWVCLGVAGGTVALVLFHRHNWVGGMIVAFIVAGLMVRITVNAYARRKPH